jgi:outer membrane protein insertion porin family
LGVVAVCLFAHGAKADESADALRSWRRKRPEIVRVDVDGNRALNDKGVFRVMQIRRPGFWSKLGLRGKAHLLTGAEERDELAIHRIYTQLGFWNAEVSVSAAPEPKTEGALVTVFITEGPKFYWGDIRVRGDDSALVQRVNSSLEDLKRGAAADSLLMEYTSSRIRSVCGDRGHPGARISLILGRRRDTIDVVFELHSGAEVHLGQLEITGQKFTRESLIRREAYWEPGELYSQKRLAWRQQDEYGTGYFSFVRLDPVSADSLRDSGIDTLDFSLHVIERKPSYIGVVTGAGQDPSRDLTWDYAFEWGSRNWRGTGRQWSLTARSGFVVITEWAVLHHQFSAKYTEPWPFGLHLPTTLTLSYEPGVRSAVQPYRVERVEGELDVTRRIQRTMRWTSSLTLERVDIYGIPRDLRASYLQEKGISVKRRFRLALERDTRPNLFVPATGALTRADLEYVGGLLGGAEDFYKVDLSWARFQVVSAPTIFASRVRFAWENTHSGGELIPTIDRYYLGGANTIRGYAENSVGPKDTTGLASGGRVVLLGNAELRAPLVYKFWFSLFADGGNNFASFQDLALDKLLLSTGVGLMYMAPVGPLRLDYARRVVHPGYSPSDRVHLSILFAF